MKNKVWAYIQNHLRKYLIVPTLLQVRNNQWLNSGLHNISISLDVSAQHYCTMSVNMTHNIKLEVIGKIMCIEKLKQCDRYYM